MNTFAKLLFAGILVLLVNGAFAQGNLDIEAPASWQTFNNGSSVRIDVARITNRSRNVTTGTVHIILRATTTPEIVGPGYTMADINMANYADDTGRLGPGEGWANISISVPFTQPPNGTYYTHIAVVEYPTLTTVRDHLTSNGTVTFGSSNPPPPPPPPPPTGDDHGNSFSTATVVSPNSSRNGRLEANGDIDVFRFTVSESGVLSLSTTGTTDTVGSLFDASQTLIAQNDDGGSGLNFGFDTPVSAGTYYIAVSGFDGATTGNYTLSVGFTPNGSNPPPPPPPSNPPAGDDGGGGGSLGWASLFALAAAAWRRRKKK